MTPQLKKASDASFRWTEANVALGGVLGNEPWPTIATNTLLTLREPEDHVIAAMVETPWPEGMSVSDQYRAILRTMVDACLGEDVVKCLRDKGVIKP